MFNDYEDIRESLLSGGDVQAVVEEEKESEFDYDTIKKLLYGEEEDYLTKRAAVKAAVVNSISNYNDSSLTNLVDDHGSCPLHHRAVCGEFKVIDNLQVGKIQNRSGVTALMLLAMLGDVDILDNEDVDTVADNVIGDTALHILAMQGKKEILSHKSSHVIKNAKGLTPFDLYRWWVINNK